MARPMPDFTAALEQRLTEAAEEARVGGRGPLPGRLVSLAAVVFVAAAALLVVGLSGHRTPRVYGAPLVLRIPPQSAGPSLQGGISLTVLAGPGSRVVGARPVHTAGGTAYVVEARGGARAKVAWCLTAPDPGARHPALERGVTCAADETFRTQGLILTIGPNLLAVVPQGVPDPTVLTRSGASRTLVPNAHGVVAATLATGSMVTFTTTQGVQIPLRIHAR